MEAGARGDELGEEVGCWDGVDGVVAGVEVEKADPGIMARLDQKKKGWRR